MTKSIHCLLIGALLGLAACESPPPQQAWQLRRDGVIALHRAAPQGLVRLEDWLWAAAPWACPPELAVGPQGEAVVTTNVAPILWRVDAKTLAVTVHPLELDTDTNKDVGFSALVYSPERAAFFAISTADGAPWSIDRDLKRAEKLAGHSTGSPLEGASTCASN